MKKVFSNADDVIHLFAQQTQYEGRSSNTFFVGTKLYSYGHHYLLAEFIKPNVVMINNIGYSVTTAKHINSAIWALSQYKTFYTKETNIELVDSAIKTNLKKLQRARKPEIYISEINNLWSKLNEYLDFMKIKNVKNKSTYIALKKIVSLVNSDGYTVNIADYEKKRIEALKRKSRKELKEKLVKFLNYEISSFRIAGQDDYIRISSDSEFIETSQYVKVPLREGVLLYKKIKNGDNIKGYQIAGYTVISINGTLKIGCHNINRKNLIEIGEKALLLV